MMYCSDCGAEMPQDARFCGRCGTENPARAGALGGGSAQSPLPQAASAAGAAARRSLSFQPDRWRLGDLIAGGGTLLLLIALFLPWYSAHQSPVTRTPSAADAVRVESLAVTICGGRSACLKSNATSISISALHGGAGGWRVLILILAIATLAYLLIRAFLPREPRLPVQHWQMVIALTATAAALAVIALLANPLSAFNGFGATASTGIGAILGVIVALATVAGGILLRPAPPRA